MTIQQLSVFVENKPGKLAEITEVLSKEDIDMRALSMADTEQFGVLRLIVNKPDAAQQALKAADLRVSLTDVIAVEVPDSPGGLSKALMLLADAGIFVEYMYAFVNGKKNSAYVILRVDNNEKAVKTLTDGGINLVRGTEIYDM